MFRAKMSTLSDCDFKIAITRQFRIILFDMARCNLLTELKNRVFIDSVQAADAFRDCYS